MEIEVRKRAANRYKPAFIKKPSGPEGFFKIPEECMKPYKLSLVFYIFSHYIKYD